MSQDHIKEIIQNLLNRTKENGCTEGEAATALAKAQQLLAKHNLTLSDLSEDETKVIEEALQCDTKSVSAIQVYIANSLKKHFGVELLKSARSDGSSKIKVVAEKIKAQIFQEAFQFAYNAFKYNWAKVARSLECTTQEKNLHRGTYLEGFMEGIVSEIERKENETALVVTKSQALTDYMSALHLGKSSHYGNRKSGSTEMYSKGYHAGTFAQRNKNHAIA